jgi:hypothetical protein
MNVDSEIFRAVAVYSEDLLIRWVRFHSEAKLFVYNSGKGIFPS